MGSRGLQSLMLSLKSEEYTDPVSNITILRKLRNLPYQCWAPCDLESTPCFQIVFFYQLGAIFLFGVYIAVADILIQGIFVHLRAQFTILHNSIVNIEERAMKKMVGISIVVLASFT